MQHWLSSFKGREASMSPRQEPQPSMPIVNPRSAAWQGPHSSNSNMHPVTVIELFQSQGCSSCPPANHHVLKLVDDPNVLVLTYDVTYWDYLGWKDTFGNREFDRRQRAYAQTLGLKNVFTPQVIANGQASGVGASARDLQSIVQKARPLGVVEIKYDADANAMHVSGPSNQRGVVNLVQYDPSWYAVPIGQGENGGSTLHHRNIVRGVFSLGEWTGGRQGFELPVFERTRLRTAVLVQTSEAGSLLGAARL